MLNIAINAAEGSRSSYPLVTSFAGSGAFRSPPHPHEVAGVSSVFRLPPLQQVHCSSVSGLSPIFFLMKASMMPPARGRV